MAKLAILIVLLLLLAFAAGDSFAALNFHNVAASRHEQPHLLKNRRRSGHGRLRSYQCPGECGRRCSQTQYHKPCIFFCNKCCSKCLCVPPGFYGNKQVCPCYNNWKTKRGGPKCP